MIINKDLTMFRCKLNQINIETSLEHLVIQENILDDALNPAGGDKATCYHIIRRELDLAMQKDKKYRGFTDEIDMLIAKEQVAQRTPGATELIKVRGHDYLKLWFKTFFVIHGSCNFIIADTATHHVLQNVLSHEQKSELIRMMRGYKRDLM